MEVLTLTSKVLVAAAFSDRESRLFFFMMGELPNGFLPFIFRSDGFMKNRILFKFSLLFCLVCLSGCGGGDFAPVTGVVTVNGQPMANVRVVFAPMATADTIEPGPPSLGVTDSEGRYELSTKDGSYGAVAGQHTVTFTYDDLDDMGV